MPRAYLDIPDPVWNELREAATFIGEDTVAGVIKRFIKFGLTAVKIENIATTHLIHLNLITGEQRVLTMKKGSRGFEEMSDDKSSL